MTTLFTGFFACRHSLWETNCTNLSTIISCAEHAPCRISYAMVRKKTNATVEDATCVTFSDSFWCLAMASMGQINSKMLRPGTRNSLLPPILSPHFSHFRNHVKIGFCSPIIWPNENEIDKLMILHTNNFSRFFVFFLFWCMSNNRTKMDTHYITYINYTLIWLLFFRLINQIFEYKFAQFWNFCWFDCTNL